MLRVVGFRFVICARLYRASYSTASLRRVTLLLFVFHLIVIIVKEQTSFFGCMFMIINCLFPLSALYSIP